MSHMLEFNPVAGRRRPTNRKVVMGILDVFKHKDKDLADQTGGTATAVKNRAKTTGTPSRKYTQQPQRPLANADDPTDQLPRFHPTTEIGRTQQ